MSGSCAYACGDTIVETLSQLGSNVSDLSKPILMEIGKAIGVYEREKAENRTAENSVQKGLANASEKRCNALKRKSESQDEQSITQTGESRERSKYDESDIREERGLSDTDGSNRRTAKGGTDEVFICYFQSRYEIEKVYESYEQLKLNYKDIETKKQTIVEMDIPAKPCTPVMEIWMWQSQGIVMGIMNLS